MAARIDPKGALISKNSKEILLLPNPALESIIPHARILRHPQVGRVLALPHKHDVVRVCRNMGYLVPAPIIHHYDWNGDTPFQTQKVTAALLTMNPRAYVLSEMGTGKTRGTLYALDYLFKEGEISRVLVAAPLSTLTQVWDREVYEHFSHLSVGIVHGDRQRRTKVLQERHHIYVINHDGVELMQQELMAMDFDVVVIDELGVYRNANTDRWRAMQAVVQDRPFVWGLTGSPTPNEPVDAWAQCKLLTPTSVPKYPTQFKRLTMNKITMFKWVPRPEANDIVFSAMQPAVRYKRDDCVELPPAVTLTKEVGMSKRQGDVYKQLVQKLRIAFQEGEVTAANEGVLFSKLLQITCGWVYTKERGIVALDNKPRIDQLEDILDEADGKVIVFVEFIHAAKALQEILAKKKIDCALVTGETPKGARDAIFTAFQKHLSPRVLVAHPKCMAHGLTLTSANIIVWFTPTTSLETYEQACARISRPGQTKKQLIIHLTGSPIETKLYRRLQQKARVQGALLEMFEDG